MPSILKKKDLVLDYKKGHYSAVNCGKCFFKYLFGLFSHRNFFIYEKNVKFLNWLYIFQADPSNSYEIEFNVLYISYLMRRNFRRSQNCCRTWNILVVVFLNCSSEINFRAPSRYRKGCMIRKKNIPQQFLLFFDTA